MKLFGQIVGTLVETVKLPVETAKDVVTLGKYGDVLFGEGDTKSYTSEQLERIIKASQEKK